VKTIKPVGTKFSTNAAPSPKIPIFAFFFDGFDRDCFKSFCHAPIASFFVQTVIVSPIFITRSSVFASRFFNSSANASGVPDSTENVP